MHLRSSRQLNRIVEFHSSRFFRPRVTCSVGYRFHCPSSHQRHLASSVKQKHNRGTDCTCARRDNRIESWRSKVDAVATSPAVGIDLTLLVWRRLARIGVATWTRFHRRGRHRQEPNGEACWHDALCSPSTETFVVSVDVFAIGSPSLFQATCCLFSGIPIPLSKQPLATARIKRETET